MTVFGLSVKIRASCSCLTFTITNHFDSSYLTLRARDIGVLVVAWVSPILAVPAAGLVAPPAGAPAPASSVARLPAASVPARRPVRPWPAGSGRPAPRSALAARLTAAARPRPTAALRVRRRVSVRHTPLEPPRERLGPAPAWSWPP